MLREDREKQERRMLTRRAAFSAASRGRGRPEAECEVRPCFQHDRDRILHSKSFRRLKRKTQVFLAPAGDHYRTRLTHTLEVTQIARTAARALRLNEDLVEAVGLGHDLGHTPFGHAGEAVLDELMPEGFRHWEQSLRVVDVLENEGAGLNLTFEVREGIAHHSKGTGEILPEDPEHLPTTLEAQVVRLADIIAYTNHDVDDAVRAGLITPADLPAGVVRYLGATSSRRIDTMVKALIYANRGGRSRRLAVPAQLEETLVELRAFLFSRVYEDERVRREFDRAGKVLRDLFGLFRGDEGLFRHYAGGGYHDPEGERNVCDFLAGMTDNYAFALHEELFGPGAGKGGP